jgi:hypothetical protein
MIILLALVLVVTPALAQAPLIATSEQQQRIKPLVDAETKARTALNAKIATLPEAKAYKDAEEALKKAGDALNKVAEALPENAAWKSASAKTLDEAYKILAEQRLSSREYRPELDQGGQLVFAKIAKQ